MPRLSKLTPMLQTSDIARTIEFYTGTLDFKVGSVWPDEKPVWCILERDSAQVMFMTNDHLGAPEMTGTLYVETTDVLLTNTTGGTTAQQRGGTKRRIPMQLLPNFREMFFTFQICSRQIFRFRFAGLIHQ